MKSWSEGLTVYIKVPWKRPPEFNHPQSLLDGDKMVTNKVILPKKDLDHKVSVEKNEEKVIPAFVLNESLSNTTDKLTKSMEEAFYSLDSSNSQD